VTPLKGRQSAPATICTPRPIPAIGPIATIVAVSPIAIISVGTIAIAVVAIRTMGIAIIPIGTIDMAVVAVPVAVIPTAIYTPIMSAVDASIVGLRLVHRQ
jgi:hypothetical protein